MWPSRFSPGASRGAGTASEERGFALLELVVALLVVSILTGVAIPTFLGARAKAQDAEAKSNLRAAADTAESVRSEDAFVNDTATLEKAEPALEWTEGPSDAPDKMAVGGDEEEFVAAARSESGTCFLLTMPAADPAEIKAVDLSPCTAGVALMLRADLRVGGLADWTMAVGKGFEMGDGWLEMGKGGGEHRAFIGDPAWTDYTVETKATLHQGNGYGVYFRSSAPKGGLPTGNATTNSLVFQYDPGLGGRFVFRRVTAGSESAPFASVDVKNTALGGPGWTWHGQERTVSVVVQGTEYTAYVDGVKVLTGTDKTFKSGGVGLRTWDGTQATFTEFTVRPNG
ncbi:MAG: prepilin-type N-terminal cleavage/methylation domain-containing protein [Actinobacteria bacterium ATB1]|nr:prepilin-type N-terminal cleavage/methylation domain-containing protein [Actinobacteria bacterium ATB1]